MEMYTVGIWGYSLASVAYILFSLLVIAAHNESQRIEEKLILTNLKEDFEEAITEFEFLNDIRNNIISAATIIYNKQPEEVTNYSSKYLDSLFFRTMSGPTYNNQAGSLNLLFNS